jgi:protein-S-isoprenylcysteine O-methyltransferase Ste14
MGFLLSGVSTLSGVLDGLVSGAAGTTAYWWRGEVFGFVWLAGTLLLLFHLLTHPALLWRRLRGGPVGEPEPRQKLIVSLLLLCVAALCVVLVRDYDSGWPHLPVFIAPIGDLLVATGLVLVWLVFRVNPFAAAAVNVETEQTVISRGPYALVRHPMYSGGLLLFLGAPLALLSWWGLVLFPPVLATWNIRS